MSTNSCLITVGSVEALVVRKPIKNLHLAVLPPQGWVRITAPQQMKDDAVRVLLATRLGWIRKQQTKFAGQERQTPREYVSGESHYLFGQRYRLEVLCSDAAPYVCIIGKTKMGLRVRPDTTLRKREEMVKDWYREQLRMAAGPIMEKWKKTLGVAPSTWEIRRMKTRWGTCNVKAGRVWLNLELAKRPRRCIEYVVLHELVHLLERKHNDRFTAHLDRLMPDWKSRRDELNKAILAHEEWPTHSI